MTNQPRDQPGAAAIVVQVAAIAVLILSLTVLVGYALKSPTIVAVAPGLQGMSPLTALGLVALAAAIFALTRGWRRVARATGWAAVILSAGMLLVHAAQGADRVSPIVARALFSYDAAIAGRMSIATAACLAVLGLAVLNRSKVALADTAAGVALLASGLAVIGYAYGAEDLYAVPMFNTMAIHTAVAIAVLAVASIMVYPDAGWAAVITAGGAGGAATRRRLAFIPLPPVAGGLLLAAIYDHRLGPGAAMAFLVVLTIAPLALLILRDGRLLNALERERREKAGIEAAQAEILRARLEEQATALALESAAREKAEAGMFQAQRMEALGQLTGGIAHDFNNLLMAIGGNLYLLTGRLPEDHPARRYANNASLATERGSRLTSQLLAFSRTQKMDIRPVELDPALSEARALLGSAMGPSIQVRLRLEAKGCWTLTDPDQLQLAILNLAVNARDAMPDGGSLTVVSGVRAAPSGNHGGGNDEGGKGEGGAGRDQAGYLSIQVRDTGEGMSREVAERAAEPFFTAKARGKGAGLGLAQVYGFVRQSQGDMRIESELGVGTTIELLLPRVTPPDAPPTPPVLAAAGVPGRPGGGRPILVIDDDDGVRAVLTEALGEAGFTVAEATSGEEGLRRLETIKPAAAIIDFIMPGMNGAEVARRAQAILPDLPIVFVSGYFDTVAVDGVNNAVVLRKPLDLTQLRTTVLSLVGWNSGNPPTPVSR